ncbi:hypothetical protein LINGRAHAP2_LOCUS6268 [Linum grandiflorum]
MLNCNLIRQHQSQPSLVHIRSCIDEARELISRDWSLLIIHTFREGNRAADRVANHIVVLLVLVFTLFLPSQVRCKIVFVPVRWEFIFLSRYPRLIKDVCLFLVLQFVFSSFQLCCIENCKFTTNIY